MVVSFICWVIRYSHHRHTEIVCWWLLLADDWQLWVGDQPPPLHINYVSVDWSTRTKRSTPTAARATRMSTMTISTVTHFSIDPPWCGWQLPGWLSLVIHCALLLVGTMLLFLMVNHLLGGLRDRLCESLPSAQLRITGRLGAYSSIIDKHWFVLAVGISNLLIPVDGPSTCVIVSWYVPHTCY